eukprot:1186378-Prorocentrum_minimum.AAC.1
MSLTAKVIPSAWGFPSAIFLLMKLARALGRSVRVHISHRILNLVQLHCGRGVVGGSGEGSAAGMNRAVGRWWVGESGGGFAGRP